MYEKVGGLGITKNWRIRIRTGELTLVIVSVIISIGLAELTVALLKPQPVYRSLLAASPAMHVEGDVLPHVLRSSYYGFSTVGIRHFGKYQQPRFSGVRV